MFLPQPFLFKFSSPILRWCTLKIGHGGIPYQKKKKRKAQFEFLKNERNNWEEQQFIRARTYVTRPTYCDAPHLRWAAPTLPACCWIVNAARCIPTYTFRWFLNYILNLDELFHLADKCVALFAEGGQAASASRGETHPTANQDARCVPLPSQAFTSCKRYTACCLWN